MAIVNNIIGYKYAKIADVFAENRTFKQNELVYVATGKILFYGDGVKKAEYLTPVTGTMGINKNHLVALIAEAKLLEAETDVYTTASIGVLTTAIGAAETARDNTTSPSQAKIDAGITALQIGIDQLEIITE